MNDSIGAYFRLQKLAYCRPYTSLLLQAFYKKMTTQKNL